MKTKTNQDDVVTCRVCLSRKIHPLMSIDGRDYWRCHTCAATLLDASQLPDAQIEHAQYMLHENDPDDPGYRGFLNRLAAPLLEKLHPPLQGLDYGGGPGPGLARMLTEAGHTVRLHDPFFHPDASALKQRYDFITCTEVAEHFHRPAEEFARLDALLRPGGWLGIMTCFQTDDHRFADWHYRRDPTHVVFYRPETFHHIASRFGWHCEIPAKNVVLLQKRITATTARGEALA